MKYHVEEFPIGFCVCDEQGVNRTHFDTQPGAKFTTEEDAIQICAAMNEESP